MVIVVVLAIIFTTTILYLWKELWKLFDTWISYPSRSCFSFFGIISITLFALSVKFIIGQSKSVFKAWTVGLCEGLKKVSSYSFSMSGLLSGKAGKGGVSRNKGVLRSLYLWSNSSLLLGSALRLLYLQSNSPLSLSFGIFFGRLRLLYLRGNWSPPSLLSLSSSSSSTSLSSKIVLLLLSWLLSILLLYLSSLAWISSSLAWPRSCFTFASLILFSLTWLSKFLITGFWISNIFASLNVTLGGIGDSKTPLFFWSSVLRTTAWLNFPSETTALIFSWILFHSHL